MSSSNNNIRNLKFSNLWMGPLSQNVEHRFASKHALNVYKSRSIYSFIPKCACSTMRLSLAIANGVIDDVKKFDWIHSNNSTFSSNLKDLVKANFTFVILRNPFLRLASTFVDKIVGKTPEINSILKMHKNIDPNEITFKKFIELICSKNDSDQSLLKANIHWRPQADFLVYSNYDQYIQFEKFEEKKDILEKKLNIKIIDARKFTLHGNDLYKQIDNKNFSNTIPSEIIKMRGKGTTPSLNSFHNKESVELISKFFSEDITLYNNIFKKNVADFKIN